MSIVELKYLRLDAECMFNMIVAIDDLRANANTGDAKRYIVREDGSNAL